ncbi:MAG: DUF1549 and DUF1553 domain-containing protein [Planctomycetia bacterium]|nr:DUF1549 and DUF1553 domain-containing protein [Planctomycetia bacterium]
MPSVVELRRLAMRFRRMLSVGTPNTLAMLCGVVALLATSHIEAALPNAPVARRFNFENDITPILSRYSCNYSGCHGKAEGQNGFKLSVFGFDAQADYDALSKEGRGRRLFLADPDKSLLLTKASGAVPHGGGVRIPVGSREYKVLRDWIAAGIPFGTSDDPKVASIRLEPKERLLEPRAKQPLRVVVRYTDGREEDVTELARYQSNNEAVATVDEAGVVSIGDVPGQAAVMAAYNGQVDVFSALVPQAPLPQSSATKPSANNFIDELVNAKLQRLNISAAGNCDDATYLRRITLDLIGTLPTAEEARLFLADTRPDKRARWVEELFERPEFADFWALQWSDLLRVDRETLGHKPAHDYYEWIRSSFADNKPFDQFARELLTADGPLAEQPQGAFYQVVKRPGDRASTVSQVFLGMRIACADCHHHPHDRWSQTDYYGMTAYFAQLTQKPTPRGLALAARGNPETKHPRTGEVVPAHALGEPLPLVESKADAATPAAPVDPLVAQAKAAKLLEDRRVGLADWMTKRDNPWFARNLSNRLWAHFLGRGLVEPVDDVRATNPPSNPELLAALAEHLSSHQFDVRQLMRVIIASATYQRSTEPSAGNERDEQNYSRALFKRMPAEVLLDAVCQTTGVPEKFAGTPQGSRAIQLWDSRAAHYFLRIFGRPLRATACSCERSVAPNVSQVLHLMNSPEIEQKLDHAGGRIKHLVATISDDKQLVDELYLTFYARYPSEDERRAALDFFRRPNVKRQESVEDLAWSLLNTLEFTFNH